MSHNLFPRDSVVWLASVKGIGFSQLGRIITYCKKHEIGLKQVCNNPWLLTNDHILKKVVEPIQSFKKEYTVSNWIEWLKSKGIKFLVTTDNLYPPLLRKVHQPPPVLFYKGQLNLDWWALPVSMVGSRNMTAYGKMATHSLVGELVDLGASTVSGGMYGVDLTVHQETIAFGGQTTVVLGHGFLHSYPKWIARDHQQLLEKGAVLISQFSPLTRPSKGSFVARNRVVAGISPSLVVIEAAEKSGTHITAQFSLDENREVCAVPGPISSPYSQGTKWLINQGARMVTSGVEILLSDGYDKKSASPGEKQMLNQKDSNQKKGVDPNQVSNQVLQLLQFQPLGFDQLLDQLKIDNSDLMVELTQLEIRGKISKFGQYYRVV